MKVGIYPYQETEDFDITIRHSCLAEELGYNSVWIAEHHGIHHMLPDPLTALAAIAPRTSNIRLGTNLIVPYYHPLDVAERGAMVDSISHGRLILGVGQGYATHEFEWFGVPISERLGRYTEGVEIIKSLWTEESIDFEGRFYTLKNVHVEPRCVQKPRPPVWILGWAESAVRRAARIGDAWYPGPSASLQDIAPRAKTYRNEVASPGAAKRSGSIVLSRFLFVAKNHEEAIEEGGRHFYRFFQETYFKWPHPVLGKFDHEASYEEVARDRFIVGTPDEVCDELGRWKEAVGYDYLIFFTSQPGTDPTETEKSMRLFMQEVAPALEDM